MKRLLFILVSLLLTTSHAQCASAQALRYLKLAGTAAWQGAKKGFQQINRISNNGALCAIVGSSAVICGKINHIQHELCHGNGLDVSCKLLPSDDLIAEFIKAICKDHNIDTILIAETPIDGRFAATYHDGLPVIKISSSTLKKMRMIYQKVSQEHRSSVLKEYCGGSIIHEIGHLKRSLLKTTIFQLLPRWITYHQEVRKKFDHYIERDADDYLHKYAFETNDPALLEHFSKICESYPNGETDSHPCPRERAETARAAAAELRELMAAEKKGLFFLRSDGQMTPMQKIYCPSSNF